MKSHSPKLPDWYPLPIYARTESLSIAEWATQIYVRAFLRNAREIGPSGRSGKLFEELYGGSLSEAFLGSIHIASKADAVLAKQDWPLKSLSWFDADVMARRSRLEMTDAERTWAERVGNQPSEWEAYLRSGAVNEIDALKDHECGNWENDESLEVYRQLYGKRVPMLVNLEIDDETLQIAFKLFLASARDSLGSNKKPYDKGDIERWSKFGLLQAFDLHFWSEANGLRYTDAFIASAIWGHQDPSIDIVSRYRKSTKELVETMFVLKTAEKLLAQANVNATFEKLYARLMRSREKVE